MLLSISFSPFTSIQAPWMLPATSLQVFPSLLQSLWKHPPGHSWRCVSMVILNPVTLSWKINHWRTIRASTSGYDNDRRVGIRRLRNGRKKGNTKWENFTYLIMRLLGTEGEGGKPVLRLDCVVQTGHSCVTLRAVLSTHSVPGRRELLHSSQESFPLTYGNVCSENGAQGYSCSFRF